MTDVPEGDLIAQGALPPEEFGDDIERIQEIASYDIKIPENFLTRIADESKDLLVDEETLLSAATALQAGHLVLQGPPGTGKSSLARALCRAFNCEVFPVTAHEDWSTFEVIGQQTLEVDGDGRERIVPTNGFFTKTVILCAEAIVRHFDEPNEPQATWLLIDELNRAHMDKAFGELFTVLGTDEPVSIILPHQKEGNRELVTPRRFRIVATLNSIDRQFVNSLSQGLRRRFTFVTFDVPPPLKEGESWGDDAEGASLASREFTIVVRRAAGRVAKRLTSEDEEFDAIRDKLVERILSQAREPLEALFNLAAQVRYARQDSGKPYLAVGTAQLIDTVELFISRLYSEDPSESSLSLLMDWAASLKFAPLFEADTIGPAQLEAFAHGLQPPFKEFMRRELLKIAASGLFYVE